MRRTSLRSRVLPPLAFALLAAPLQAQSVARVVADTVPAPSLAGNLLGDLDRQPAFVYLPPDYDEEPDRRYSVIYLLHGVLDSPRSGSSQSTTG